MSMPARKDALLAALSLGFGKLERELSRVPGDAFDEVSLDGHSRGERMSVHDLIAYLIGWSQLVRKWCRLREEGVEPDFPETGFKWNELGLLARKFYADHAALTPDELKARLATAHADIVALVSAHSDAELYGVPWYSRYTLGRMIQLNTVSPYANACGRLRRWKKQKAGLT